MATKTMASKAKKAQSQAKKSVRQVAKKPEAASQKVKKVATSQLKDLKDSVLSELSALEQATEQTAQKAVDAVTPSKSKKVTQKVPLAPTRFEALLVPEMTRLAWKNQAKAWVFRGVLAAVAAGLVVIFFMTGQTTNAPEKVVEKTVEAIEKQNWQAFDEHVNVSALAASVVDQVFQISPNVDDTTQQRLADVVRPGLVKQMQDQMRLWVKEGDAGLAEEAGILPQLLHEAGAEAQFGDVVSVALEGNQAVAEVLLVQQAWAAEVPVMVQLMQVEDAWQIVGVNGVQNALQQFAEARERYQQAQQAQIQEQLNAAIVVEEIEKAAGISDFAAGRGVLLSAAVRNTTVQEVVGVTLAIAFKDAAGQMMKTFVVEDEDGIPAGETLEKTWTLVVNPNMTPESHIYALPQNSLRIEIMPQAVTFADGTKLELPAQ